MHVVKLQEVLMECQLLNHQDKACKQSTTTTKACIQPTVCASLFEVLLHTDCRTCQLAHSNCVSQLS